MEENLATATPRLWALCAVIEGTNADGDDNDDEAPETRPSIIAGTRVWTAPLRCAFKGGATALSSARRRVLQQEGHR